MEAAVFVHAGVENGESDATIESFSREADQLQPRI